MMGKYSAQGAKAQLFLTLCVVCFSLIPKFLVFANGAFDPFTNSLIALGVATQATGHIPVNPYTILGSWQTHANFISSRGGVVSFLAIMSSVTGVSVNSVSHLPLTGIMFVLIAFVLGRRIGNLLLGLLFAVLFGFMWHPTLTSTSLGYEAYGNLLQFVVIFVLVWRCADENGLQRNSFLAISLLFIALLQTYYMAEFLTAVIITVMSILSISFKKLKMEIKSLAGMTYLALYCCIVFLAFDTVMYTFIQTESLGLLFSTLSNYVSYVFSIIFGKTAAIQEFRPYTNPISKYLDLLSSVLTWLITIIGIAFYLNTLRKSKSNKLTQKGNVIHIIILSLLFTFAVRTLIYGIKGKIAIGWIYQAVIVFALIQIWLISRLRTKLKYLLPILLVCMSITRFSLIWTDQTMSMVADYSSTARPSANWIGHKIYSGSIVSSNQLSAEVFGAVAEFGKANSISVNQFGYNAKNLLTGDSSDLNRLFLAKQYNYLLLSRRFASQPVFGGFWGPYIPPLGNKLEIFNNYTCLSRIFDDGLSTLYGFNSPQPKK